MAASPSRTSPTCGARNSDRSIFCAECGASLTATSDAWPDSDATQSFEPVRPDATWQRPGDIGQRTSPGSTTTTPQAAPPRYATFEQGWRTDPAVNEVPITSSRGFWLGLLAWVLIAVVFGCWLWAGPVPESLKDDIRDIVPGLSQIVNGLA